MYFLLLIVRDVALYALGVGACGQQAVDADELKYVYNENGQEYIEVLHLQFVTHTHIRAKHVGILGLRLSFSMGKKIKTIKKNNKLLKKPQIAETILCVCGFFVCKVIEDL